MQKTSTRRHERRSARWIRAARTATLPPATVLALGVAGLVAPAAVGPLPTEGSIDSQAAVPPVSTAPFETPASQTRLVVRRGPGLAAGLSASPAAAHGEALDIPAPALAAYQRAEAVMDEAHPVCRLPWELLAAIGRVESDHGRHGNSALDPSGRARPAIIGIRLDGRGPVAAIRDTDAGALDGDVRWDRAVGPMQFIPSTWSVVGVDADGDGKRDPQDIDDAALAAAVYLCAGNRDLAKESDREAAVHSYNHDDAYVALVLRIFESYAAGAFAGTPPGTVVVHAAVAVQTRAQHTDSDSGPRDNTPPRPPDPPASAPDESTEPTPGPVTEAPEGPAAEEPPSTDPPATEPPPTDPPPTEGPTGEPTEPPTCEATEPPTCEATQPPTEEPPVEEPTGEPTTEPPPAEESTEPPVPPDGEGEVGLGTTTEPEPTPSSTP